MIEWLRVHWYWALGGLVGLYVLLRIFKGTSSASASVSTPATGTNVVYSGTSANDAAVQVAQIQNQSELAATQIAANQAVQQAQLAVQAQASANSANVQIAGIQADAADVTSTNNLKLGIVQSNNGASVAIVQANDALELGMNTNSTDLAALQNSNATQLAAYGIQASVINNANNAYRDIAIATTNDAAQLQSQHLAYQDSQVSQVLAEISKSGGFNSQHGGANSVAALSSIVNPATSATASVGASGAASVIDQPSNIASIISSIGASVNGGLKQVFA